jgi:hypothetical protein
MSRKCFRFLILLTWVLTAGCLTLFFVEKRALPYELRSYLDRQAAEPLTAFHWVLFAVALLALAVGVLNTVGLYRFRPWARTLYLWTCVVSYATLPFLINGAAVEPPFTALTGALNNALRGATLALLYFSPIARFFDAEPGQSEEV